MEALYSLIKSLNSKEVSLVRNSLSCFYARPNASDSNTLALFELLQRRKNIPDSNFISRKLYNKKKDNTLDKLSSRLKGKILDVLISESNNERNSFDLVDFFTIKVRKKFTQFYQLYFSKGNKNSTCHNLLLEIIDLSLKYESYSPLIEALRISRYFQGFNKGMDDFKQIQEKIIFYEYCNQCVYKAIDYYYKLTIGREFSGTSNIEKKQAYLNEAITELGSDYKKTKSAIVGYYLHQLQLAYCMNEGNYNEAHHVCTQLLSLLKNHKSIYRESRVAFMYGNLAQFDIYLKKFDNAVENVGKALKLQSRKDINFAVSTEVLFHALFYGSRNKEAKIVIEDLISISGKQFGGFRSSRFQFFYASLLFQERDFKRALNILNTNAGISKDKPGWDIALRVLKIMCMIELAYLDTASNQIDNLRKHIAKYKAKEVGKRNILIYKSLTSLDRNGFNFKETDLTEKISFLAGNDKNYRWTYMSPELIPFHKWITDKTTGTDSVLQ